MKYTDAFISKFNSDLTTLLASTFIGGGNGDEIWGLVIDGADNIYVTGDTYYHTTSFPTTGGAYDESHNGYFDVFVSLFSNDLSTLSKSTLIGGNSSEYAYAIALNGGNVFITGKTNSNELVVPYPTTTGAYDEDQNDGDDVFISKFNSTLSTLVASTFIGGKFADEAWDLDFDSNGNVFVTGFTSSNESPVYPTTAGAYDQNHNGAADVFISKLPNALNALTASTFIGGSNSDYAYALDIDSNDNIFIAGFSHSGYPTTAGAYDQTYSSQDDVIVSKFTNDLSTLSASTYIGDTAIDYCYDVIINGNNEIIVTGSTGSDDWPTSVGAYDTSNNGSRDVYITELDNNLTTVNVSTFIGGTNNDEAYGIAFDGDGNIVVAGWTGSSDYPTTDGCYDSSQNGNIDVLVSIITDDLTLPIILSSFTAQYINDTPTLCWTTQSETSNAGWNIYRGESEDALQLEEAIQLNNSLGLIPGAGTTSEPTDYSFEDVFPVYQETTYFYWLESVDYSGETGNYGPITLLIPEDEEEPGSPEIPGIYGLHQNYPNPFNPNTEISFMLKENCIAELSVYNIKGEKITTLFQNKSVAKDELIRVNWDGKDDFGKEVSTGVYYYKLRTTKADFVRKMILLK